MIHRVEVEAAAERVELVAAALWVRGAQGVWERPDGLVAWFDAPDGGAFALPASPAGGPLLPPELESDRLRWSVEPDRDWQEEWKATISPVTAGRIVVVPTWLATDHLAEPHELTLVLDPGRAFGSGHHATTTLCLELLDDLDLAGSLAGRTVVDVGCGTGVLAIAAAAMGARATAVDVDPTAIEVTRHNASGNHVEVMAFAGSVGDLTAPAEVVVANLVTDVIVALAAPLVAACTSTLIVSGIASERQRLALDALHTAGARTEEVRERDGWIAARLSIPRASTERP